MLTDTAMPDNMTGLELAQKLRVDKPKPTVPCASGYSGETMADVLAPLPGIQFFLNPYPPRVLAKAVRDALEQAREAR